MVFYKGCQSTSRERGYQYRGGVGSGVGKLIAYWEIEEINTLIILEARFFTVGKGSYKYGKGEN